MQDYVRSSIMILNDTTEELENLNKLGIYLSKQTDINALKVLKLLILASETKDLKKTFDINHINTYIYLKERITGIEHIKKENVVGNLSMNPQNFALELFEYIIKNYPVNLDFECYGSYSIFDVWNRSFQRMNYNDMDLFYKRYDMVDKKLDIFDFWINNGILSQEQLDYLIHTYLIMQCDNNLTTEQKQRIQNRVKQIQQYKELHKNVSSIKNITNEERKKQHDIIDKITEISIKPNKDIYIDRSKNARNEIAHYRMQNDQCIYMLEEIPKLIKKKII